MTELQASRVVLDALLEVGEVKNENVNVWPSVFKLPGHSSFKQRVFLNQLFGGSCSRLRYLEVGAFHGASVLSAAFGNFGSTFYTIDNFALGTREQYLNNIALYGPDCGQIHLLEKNILHCASTDLPKDIDVFFYDANWTDTVATSVAINLLPNMSETFILIVDNWVRPMVRSMTRGMFGIVADLKMFASWELLPEQDCDIRGWGNGWCVMVLQKKKPLSVSYLQMRKMQDTDVPLWDFKQRYVKGLFTIEDYDR